jgi:hypothetical protein
MNEDQDQFELDEEGFYQRRRSSSREERKPGDKKVRKAPLPYRIVAWISLIMICFGLGYFGTSMLLDATGKDAASVDKNVVSNQDELEEVLSEKNQAPAGGELGFTSNRLNIYIPSGESIEKGTITVNPSAVMEDKIKSVVHRIGNATASNGFSDRSFRVIHVFRTGDMLYLDMTRDFQEAVKSMGERKASILMTSIVRSMVENFVPVSRVRILVQGNVPSRELPVNLSVAWQLTSSLVPFEREGLVS